MGIGVSTDSYVWYADSDSGLVQHPPNEYEVGDPVEQIGNSRLLSMANTWKYNKQGMS